METAGSALTGERRVVTALFCDVVGSTSIAEQMDPEDWSEVMGDAMTTMSSAVSRFGGTVTEFAGDGVVALFGAPVAHEDDPFRAVCAGSQIVAEMRRSRGGADRGLDVRVGIHTGLVVVGDIEAGELNTYSALGDTLNVAARLQTEAEPGTVVISRETRRLLGNDIEARELGPTALKGRTAPVVLYEVLDVKEPEERRRGLPGLVSPMVGRREELRTLQRLATVSAAGTGRVAAILGDAGVGKSRLLAELGRDSHNAEDELWAVGTCVPFDDEMPYHLASSLLRSLAGVGASEAPEVVGKAIDDLAERAGVPESATLLRSMVGVDLLQPDSTTEEDPSEEYGRALVDLVTALAREYRLTVLACEDAHWADPSSVNLILEVVRRVPTLPILLVLVMRPDRNSAGWRLLEVARRELAESLTEVDLAALDEVSSRDLVSNLLEVESLPPTLRRLVLDKAEGNPFFLEEVVRMLIDRGLLENRAGRWIAVAETGDLDVPETIEGLLASRIDLLAPELRRAGRVASVIGRRFPAHIFDLVYEGDVDEKSGSLHPHLAGLESHRMVRLEEIEPELEFGFRHALIHDVLYQGLLRRERRELHGSVARALEIAHPDQLEECAPSLARHYAEAGAIEKAVHHFLVAGRHALARGARVEASRFYARAQELLEADAEPRSDDLVDAVIGRVTAGMGFIPGPEAIRLIEDVLPVAEALDDPDRLARLYERLIWTRGMQGETYADPVYRAGLDAGYDLIPLLTDEGTSALLKAMMGGAHRSIDEFESSIEPLAEAVEGLEAKGRWSEASYNAAMLADSLTQVGRFDEALAAVQHARELGEQSGDPNAVLDADIIRGSIAADMGDLEDAMEYTRRGIEGAEAHGNTFCNLAANFKLADQQLRLGNVGSAITHLEKSTGLAQYCNAGGYEVLGQAWLAMARSRAGDPRPEDFDAPLAAAIDSGSRSTEGLVRLQRGVTLAADGQTAEAWTDFERAIELFDAYGGLPNLARAHHAYGEALEAAGLPDEAISHLRKAEELFTRLGIRPDPVAGS
jgi:class 3 adenylate cyclase/tetratricopeptide (TPR) repeat protein